MAERFYTILVLPDATSRARRFHLTKPWLRCGLVTLSLTIFGVAYLLYHYLTFQVNYLELRHLRAAQQEREVLAERVQGLQKELDRLREFDKQIRLLAGLDKGKGRDSAVAVGGGVLVPEEALKEGKSIERERLLERMHEDLQRLEREIAFREQSFKALTDYLKQQRDKFAATPSISPVQGFVSSEFGPRQSPFTGRQQLHTGIDIAAPPGTSIVAPADGVVTYSGKLGGYGYTIVINHGFGFKTFYGHNQKNIVREGDRVKRGQVIGYVGNSGYSTGSHLHYEILVNDTPVDPTKYIIDEAKRADVIKGR